MSEGHQRRGGAGGTLPNEAYRLLAHANLLRIRGQWQEAIEECMAAMRLLPGNASAQSLLGDIYENQGNIDDAIQWYRMALDVNPGSPADQVKLRRLLAAKAQSIPVPGELPKFPPRAAVQPYNSFPVKRPRPRADRVLRIAAVTSAITVTVIIAAGFWPRPKPARPHPPTPMTDRIFEPVPTLFEPVNTPPGNPPPSINLGWRDGGEAAVLNTLRANNDLSNNNLHVADCLIDPRDRHLTVTVSADTLPSVGRDYFLRQSLRVLRAAGTAVNSDVSTFTVRFLSAPTDGVTPASPTLVFTADTSRPFVPEENQDVSTLTPTQIQSMLSNIWWSPLVP